MKNVCFALMCFLSCLNGFINTQSIKKERISLKIGENITLNLATEDIAGLVRVLWAKEDNTFLKIYNNSEERFLNENFQSRVCFHNLSSITICNATSEDAGLYTAFLKREKEDVFKKYFYVGEHAEKPVVLEVTTFASLRIVWSKDNGTEIAAITYNNSLDIQLTMSQDFCGETTYVTAMEGQALLLQMKGPTSVRRTEFASISYRDSAGVKLKMSHNGSILIDNVTKEDQGNYTVMIERWGKPKCNHTYIVTTSDGTIWRRDERTRGIAAGISAIFLVIIIVTMCCRHNHNRRNRSNCEPVTLQENASQEMEPLSNNSHQQQQNCANGYNHEP